MEKRRGKQGFTLMEMLIVVAIIAILVTVAIPVFTSVLTKSRETTCLANRTALRHELTTMGMLSEDYHTTMTAYTPSVIQTKGYVCPNETGEIRLSYDSVTGDFSVYCSEHGGLAVGYNMGSTVAQFMNGGLGDKLAELLKKNNRGWLEQIDSTAPEGGNYAGPVAQRLAELTNHSLGTGMATTWSLCDIYRSGDTIKSNYKVYWSSADISQCDNNGQLLLMKYDAATGTYQAGWATVKRNSASDVGNGKVYNIIQTATFTELAGSSSTSFETAYQSFQEALAESETGLRSAKVNQ